MARIKTNIYTNTKSYSIIEDYKRNGKRTTRVIDNIGNYEKVSKLANEEGIDVDTWLNNYLINFKREHNIPIPTEMNEITIKKYANKLIPSNITNKFNVGYLFLEDIYYSLKLDKICKIISQKYKFEFNLNEVLSNLIYSRIIYPSSKLKTYELSKSFIETPKYNLNNLYRGLTYLNKDLDYIQKELYNNSKLVVDRNTRIIYYDCTNYYFDISEEDDLRKYTGNAKDKKAKPVVGMGLFLDGKGYPIAMNIFPGNANESTTLIPLQEKIIGIDPVTKIEIEGFDLENDKTIICTDAAMCTDEIKKFNIKDGKAFVITQSIKKLKEEYKNEVFEDDNWRIVGDLKHIYKLSDILNDEDKCREHYETIFYKIVQTETAHVVQDLIVTFQIKYRDYLRNVRNGQIERAKNKIKANTDGKKIKLSNNPNDYRRLIKEDVTTITKKIKKKTTTNDNSLNEEKQKEKYNYSYSIDNDIIREEEKYDGYYGVTTNLNGDIEAILNISKNRWEIEENFRILKSDFESGDIYLSREDRITAHFLTCFISLLIYRILENKLDYKYTNTQIIDKLREMEVYEEKGVGYSPAYVRNDLTDDLHKAFGFRTDYEIINYENFEKIFKQLKK
ncbi:MAG: IS1634 family transposase [Bacilli bacterium]|nr:IS1634 family transposase [Bacilli bacterium]